MICLFLQLIPWLAIGSDPPSNDPNNVGAECWTNGGCRSSAHCEYCGTGKCCKQGWEGGDPHCFADEGGVKMHVCVAPSGYVALPRDTNITATDEFSAKWALSNIRGEAGAWFTRRRNTSSWVEITFPRGTWARSLRLKGDYQPNMMCEHHCTVNALSNGRYALVHSYPDYVQLDFNDAVGQFPIQIKLESSDLTFFAIKFVSFLPADAPSYIVVPEGTNFTGKLFNDAPFGISNIHVENGLLYSISSTSAWVEIKFPLRTWTSSMRLKGRDQQNKLCRDTCTVNAVSNGMSAQVSSNADYVQLDFTDVVGQFPIRIELNSDDSTNFAIEFVSFLPPGYMVVPDGTNFIASGSIDGYDINSIREENGIWYSKWNTSAWVEIAFPLGTWTYSLRLKGNYQQNKLCTDTCTVNAVSNGLSAQVSSNADYVQLDFSYLVGQFPIRIELKSDDSTIFAVKFVTFLPAGAPRYLALSNRTEIASESNNGENNIRNILEKDGAWISNPGLSSWVTIKFPPETRTHSLRLEGSSSWQHKLCQDPCIVNATSNGQDASVSSKDDYWQFDFSDVVGQFPIQINFTGQWITFFKVKFASFLPEVAPINCQLSEWQSWGNCTKECGNGTQSRNRAVKQDQMRGGDPCGDLTEEKQCNVDACPSTLCVTIHRHSKPTAWARNNAPCSDIKPVRCCDQNGKCSSYFKSVCHRQKNFADADYFCREQGMRLCTTDEYKMPPEDGGCRGTGCSFDNEGVWISDIEMCDILVDPPENRRIYSSVYGNEQNFKISQLTSSSAWVAKKKVTSPYMIIDLEQDELVSGTAVAGRNGRYDFQYVTGYTVNVGRDSGTWELVGDFRGESAQTTNMFTTPKYARYVKLTVKAFNNHPSMRAGILVKRPCAVDCKMSNWAEWEPCSLQCGGGEQSRSRTIEQEALYDGKPCATTDEYRICNMHQCPVNCQLSEWQSWGNCTKECGKGTQSRKRTVKWEQMHGGDPCGDLTEEKPCNVDACPIDCEMNNWAEWEPCSQLCEGGEQSRYRTIVQEANYGGKQCAGTAGYRTCNTHKCPVWETVFECGQSMDFYLIIPPDAYSHMRICVSGSDTDCVVSKTKDPLNDLRTTGRAQKRIDFCDYNCIAQVWNGPPTYLEKLTYTCSPIDSYRIYHACGNGVGLHVPTSSSDKCTWNDKQQNPLVVQLQVVICDENYRVSNNTCILCPAGTIRNAGDHASGNDTFCEVPCLWSVWSSWSDACNGDCGLPTARKFRYRYVEQQRLHSGSKCEGESVQSEDCNFPVCNSTMYCEGSLLSGNLTKELFKERRLECREKCKIKCTQDDLCGDAPVQRSKVWKDPNWTRRWFGTILSKFMAEIAMGDSFEYPSVSPDRAYKPCMWLLPTCANASECEVGSPFKREPVRHILDNFYQWYFSEGNVNTRASSVGERQRFNVGGRAMKSEDAKSPNRDRCVSRCRSWCYESCSCNWGWEFPWSNEEDMGWAHGKPMRYRWIRNVQRKQSYGTWTCVSSDGEPLRTPWDKPFWHLDVYSDAVKQRVNVAPLQFNLVCEHIKHYYALQVCGTEKCKLDCTKAAQPVVDFLYTRNMLQPKYMKKGGKKHRALLVDRLHTDIHKNCRRTCAEAHVPAFLHLYPIH